MKKLQMAETSSITFKVGRQTQKKVADGDVSSTEIGRDSLINSNFDKRISEKNPSVNSKSQKNRQRIPKVLENLQNDIIRLLLNGILLPQAFLLLHNFLT